jgi:hypothetical protein
MFKETIMSVLAILSFVGAMKYLWYEIVDLKFYRKLNWNFDAANKLRDKSLRVNEFDDKEPSNATRVVVIQPLTIIALLILSYFLWT